MVSNKTFNLVNNLLDYVSGNNFFLINALAIDINWNNLIQCAYGSKLPCRFYNVHYAHEDYSDWVPIIEQDKYPSMNFNNNEGIKSVKIGASLNNYDIVKELGEENIKNTDAKKINEIVDNLKEIKLDIFKDGVITKINGSIPLFKYDYELKLMEDLQSLGVNNVFDINKSDLSNMISEEKQYINKAIHKADIEFSNEGIKAAVATALGGAGSSTCWDYKFKVPVEEIDLTFDKPYMYIIRDKATGEVWFTGTVYSPITQ